MNKYRHGSKIRRYVLGGYPNPDAVTAPITYNPGFNPVNKDEASYEDMQAKDEEKARKKKQRQELLGLGLESAPYLIDTVVSYSKQLDQNERLRNQLRDLYQQDPIYDINNMYGDNQPIIKAEKGAMVRSSASPSAPFRIDNGEFLLLPDGSLERAEGSSKKTDDIATILPVGTKIFSNTLKPKHSNKTFAMLAKEQDYMPESDVIKNPYASEMSITSAERMLQRKQSKLNSLFNEQQSLNGDSSGECPECEKHMANGGWIQSAIKHPGRCTPGSPNYDCPKGSPQWNLAQRFKHGDLHHHEYGGMAMEEYAHGGIYIKPKNRGKFTKYAEEHGMGVQEAASHILANKEDYSPTLVKRANFARVFGGRHYKVGGEYDLSEAEIQDLRNQGYDLEILQ